MLGSVSHPTKPWGSSWDVCSLFAISKVAAFEEVDACFHLKVELC